MGVLSYNGQFEKAQRIIYTPSQFAKENLLHLQETGSLQAHQPHTNSRKNLASYLFFVVISGKGTLAYDTKEYCLSAGDCVFIDCRIPYSHSTGDNLWNICWAHFNGPTMKNIYAKYEERGGTPCFRPQNSAKYISAFDDIYKAASSGSHIRDMVLCEKLSGLLTLLMEDSWAVSSEGDENNTTESRVNEIKDYLDQHFEQKLSLDLLSEKFYLNKYYLTRIFKKEIGITINTYITHIRITNAKQLLRFSADKIEQIAIKCGLEDANYFSRMFKKAEGMSPVEYRRIWKS